MRTFEMYFVLIIFGLDVILAEHGHKEFFKKLTALHNQYRQIHGAGQLKLVREMSIDALNYANRWKQGEANVFVQNDKYGFNTYSRRVANNELPKATDVFMNWYNNYKNYDSTKEPLFNEESASFTQIVWKSTTHLGLAMVKENGIVMIVAVYSPPGNIEGEYSLNV